MKKTLLALVLALCMVVLCAASVYAEGLSGSGTKDAPFMIKTAADLKLFRDSVNAGETDYNEEGKWVALGADIDLNNEVWTVGIGDGHEWSFDGNFDGKGHTIKNLKMEPYADESGYLCGGLFGYIYGGVTICNLTLENVTITSNDAGHNIGAVVGYANNNGGSAKIENVTVKGNIQINVPNVYGVGGIVGYSYRDHTDVIGCTVNANTGSEIKGYSFVGGIIGYSFVGSSIKNCSVKNIAVTGTSLYAGGIVGLASGKHTISGCTTADSVKVSAALGCAGSVVGAIDQKSIELYSCAGAELKVGGDYKTKSPIQAQIGNVYYVSLEQAMDAAKPGETVIVPDSADIKEYVDQAELSNKHLEGLPASCDTVEEVVALMQQAAEQAGFTAPIDPETGKVTENIKMLDVELYYVVDGKKVLATAESFPEEGIIVELDIPKGANAADHEFMIIHMFTEGSKAGKIEKIRPEVKGNKLVVKFTSLSPVAITWKDKPIVVDLPKTGDNSSLALWVVLMGLAGAGMMMMRKRKCN